MGQLLGEQPVPNEEQVKCAALYAASVFSLDPAVASRAASSHNLLTNPQASSQLPAVVATRQVTVLKLTWTEGGGGSGAGGGNGGGGGEGGDRDAAATIMRMSSMKVLPHRLLVVSAI